MKFTAIVKASILVLTGQLTTGIEIIQQWLIDPILIYTSLKCVSRFGIYNLIR